MWSKFFRIPVLLLFLAIVYYGCVEEPTIDPVKRPYTLLRVANFSYNVDTLIVSIDSGKTILTLYMNQPPTQYFEITSGKRHFLVKNSSGNILYNDRINIGAYEELSLYFTGFSKPNDDLLNTFGYAQYINGAVYLYEGVEDTASTIYCANFAPDTPDDSSKKYIIHFSDTSSKAIIKEIPEVAPNSVAGVTLSGNKTYTVSCVKDTSPPNPIIRSYLTYSDTVFTFEKGTQYLIYLIGTPKKPRYVFEKLYPLPIRSK